VLFRLSTVRPAARYHPVMTVDVLTEVVIARPCADVAAFAADPDNVPSWYSNITSVRWQTAPPVRVGSRIAFEAKFLGRQLAYTYEVTDYEPGSRLVMSTAQGPFPMQTTYTWTPEGYGSTRMTLRNTGEPAGFGKVAAPVMATAMRRASSKDLASLRQILESAGS
jgi:uncharacterized protein YndB with AHSA1/START domain